MSNTTMKNLCSVYFWDLCVHTFMCVKNHIYIYIYIYSSAKVCKGWSGNRLLEHITANEQK